ncbi:hypothetical protein [Mesorhizobium sp. B2-6-7]|uniref:lytic transglycosylase domain-containing protein n=1 Tax=Mesorhizobium sp. B2-6-7 TaxID=2589910 RepID=UPI00112D19AC|nr:hypothetical protein [Mesorhizobium sp. B2-6-7]TPJ70458.1 hypothetical protein FJ462_07115 [Mesorhizobium sp. B2-6-7]
MAVIPLQVASRSLDTGNVVQYPGGGEIGRALQGAGDELSQIAEHFKAKQDQQDRFDAGVVDDELRQRLAQAEDDAVRNAPADGSGIHDSVYGQMDVNGRAVRPGAFDTLFDEYAQKVPESQRANFMASKEAMRLAGSNRTAGYQQTQRQAYEQVELTKSQDTLLNGILQSDPNDTQTFEAFKQNGLDRIAASGMSALDKEKAAYNWNQSATKGLFQSMLDKDPSFAGKARAALGLAPVAVQGGGAVNTVVDRIIGVESGGSATAKNPNSSASGVGQFLDSTWVQTIRQHRPDLADGKSAAQIIALKTDPVLGRQMVAAFTQDNADYLTNRGIATTPGNLYLAHFLGSQGAVNVLKADPNASIASVVGQDVVRANGFLAGKTVADTIAWSDKKMGSAGGGAVDPRFAGLSPDDRLTLANQADVQYRQQQAAEKAQATASYTAYKDRFELGIVDGSIADPALIHNDKTLNDGDKASLLRSFNEQNKGTIQLQGDLSALQGGTLSLDPYASDDKKRADNLYSAAAGKVPLEQQAGLATTIIQQTHVVPQPIINDMRRGLSSQNPGQVIAAAQTAQKISSFDPAALGRRDGGSEVQKAADDFSYYVKKLNLSPEEAARRMIDNASPEKQRDRKALEPAAREFVKTMGDVDLSSEFKDGGIFSGAPALGLDPAQEAGIKADFLAMAEDQFYAANGDPDLAKNRALEQMKAIYGVSRMSGSATVVKYPPERYWPKEDSAGFIAGVVGADDPLRYAKAQLRSEIDEFSGRGPAGPITQFAGRIEAGNIDLANRPQVANSDGSISTVRSMSFEEDGREVLVPTVSPDGKILTDQQAIDLYHQTGQHLGKFDTPDHADAYAQALHQTQEQYYRGDLAIDPATVRLVTTPETEADVKAGRLPGYAVMWKDVNGNLQTIPGKVWRPDVTKMLANQTVNRAKTQAEATANARQNDALYEVNILTGEPMQPKQPAGIATPSGEPGANIPADIPAKQEPAPRPAVDAAPTKNDNPVPARSARDTALQSSLPLTDRDFEEFQQRMLSASSAEKARARQEAIAAEEAAKKAYEERVAQHKRIRAILKRAQ